MPLKPGQKKEIKVKVQKIQGLQAALKKAKEYEAAMDRYAYATPSMTDSIKKKVDALKAEIQKEYNILKSEIATIKQQHAKDNKGATDGVDKLAKTIAKECSQIIPLYRKTKLALLRGMDNSTTAFVGRSWENRKTKDSDHKLQAYFDMYLKSQGFKALRSNSIFTTTDESQANEYGEIYYIYPKNGFAYHWYTEQTDLVIDDPGQVFNTDKLSMLIDNAIEWYERKFDKVAPAALDNLDNYDDPIKTIKVLQKIGYPKAAKLTPAAFIDGPGIRLDIGPTQKNLLAGLKEGGEVCIAGEYYAIRAGSSVARGVNKALGLKLTNGADDYSDVEDEDEDSLY